VQRRRHHAGGLYCSAKLGWNRRSGFDNMDVFQFREFGWKTPIHAQKLGFWGFYPLNGEQGEQSLK